MAEIELIMKGIQSQTLHQIVNTQVHGKSGRRLFMNGLHVDHEKESPPGRTFEFFQREREVWLEATMTSAERERKQKNVESLAG